MSSRRVKLPDRAERLIALSGGHNFRDMGGYPAAGGRHTAWGRLYRSGTMVALADEDHAVLDRLQLRLVCDLRSTRERTNKPSRLPARPAYEVWSRDHRTSAADVVEAIQSPEAHEGSGRELMRDLYRDLPYEQSESYKVLFARIAAGDLPLVFHCTAGKDRTGVAAALLLDLIGVPREVIFEDFALTDHAFDNLRRMILDDPEMGRLADYDQRLWEPLLRADPAYLESLFHTIESSHGSTADYMREVLGLTDEQITAIADNLLD
jgi:protein-tyrosine phosphatase